MIAHMAGLPVEELLPVLVSSGGVFLLAGRASLWRLRRKQRRAVPASGRGAVRSAERQPPRPCNRPDREVPVV